MSDNRNGTTKRQRPAVGTSTRAAGAGRAAGSERTNRAQPGGARSARPALRRSADENVPRRERTSERVARASSQARTGSARRKNASAQPSFGRRVLGGVKRVGLTISKAVSGFNHLFDRFRTSETKRIVTNVLLTGVLLLLLACVFMLLKPGINAARAVSQAEKGNSAEAMQLLSKAEKDGLGASKLDKTRLEMAQAFTSQGSYTLARQLISEVGDKSKANVQSAETDYTEASELYRKGSFQSAAQVFYRLGSYRDSAEKYKDCLCAIAIKAYLEGSEARARSLLAELDDAETRLPRVCSYFGRADLANEPLFSPESLRHMRESYAQLKQNRQAAQKGLIAAGARHSLVLRSDGTVLAQGDNSNGQCNTGAWNAVVMVAAGERHSVGLNSNGTVVACGDNSEGQCNVGAWNDIKAIAAGAYVTVGLKNDGSIVWCGRGKDAMDAWQDVQLVSAGGYSISALTVNGTMLSSHGAALLPVDIKMIDLAVCGQTSVGILYDGSLISSLQNAPDWRDLKSVAASETGIFAVTLSGAVKAQYYRPGDNLNINIGSGAVEIAASGTHALVLTNDGRVHAFGDNSYGQCQVNNITR